MIIHLNTFLNKKIVAINEVQSYNADITAFLRKKTEIICQYQRTQQVIENAYDISIQCGRETEKQYELITNQFSKTVDEFICFLIDNDYKFICFHLARLFPYEVDDILNNGLIKPTKKKLKDKIKQSPISVDEKEKLLNYIDDLKQLQADNSTYYQVSNRLINESIDSSKVFLNCWGGETIYNYFEYHLNSADMELKEKIINLSKPKIIIVALDFRILNKGMFEKILLNYPHNLNNIAETILNEYHTEKILGICDFSVNDKIFF